MYLRAYYLTSPGRHAASFTFIFPLNSELLQITIRHDSSCEEETGRTQ
jgi:hypothetical protein